MIERRALRKHSYEVLCFLMNHPKSSMAEIKYQLPHAGYNMLKIFEDKGYVTSTWWGLDQKASVRRKRLYTLTKAGIDAVEAFGVRVAAPRATADPSLLSHTTLVDTVVSANVVFNFLELKGQPNVRPVSAYHY